MRYSKLLMKQQKISYEKVTPKKTRTIDVKEFVKEPIVASVKEGYGDPYNGYRHLSARHNQT